MNIFVEDEVVGEEEKGMRREFMRVGSSLGMNGRVCEKVIGNYTFFFFFSSPIGKIDVVLFFLLHCVRVCVFLSEISNLLMRCKIVIINYNLNL